MRHPAIRLICVICGIVAAGAGLSSQPRQAIPRGAAVFVENMPNGLDGFIRAALFDRQVPLRVVLKREEAHLVIAGESTATQKTAWHEGWLTGAKDKAEGNVMVFDRASRSLIMTAQAGDRSLLWGNLAKGGQRKVAERLVDKIKDNVSKNQTTLPAPPPLAPEEAAILPAGTRENKDLSDLVASAIPPMTNQDVIDLSAAGMGDDLILSKIRSSKRAFDTSTAALVALKKAGISEVVLAEMLKK